MKPLFELFKPHLILRLPPVAATCLLILITLITPSSTLNAQVFNSTGGKIHISGGAMNVQGKMMLDTASILENKATLKTDSLKSAGEVKLTGNAAELVIDSGIILEEGQLQLNSNKLVILNSDSSALQITNGKLFAGDSLFSGRVQWHIAENSGQKYIVPLSNDSLQDISMEFRVTQPGLGLEGYVEFSTYHTDNNNEPLPLDTASDAARMLLDSPLEITDRFWKITPVNYADVPSATMNLRYACPDTAGSDIVHDSLILSRWNNNCWTDVPGAINPSSRKFDSDTINQYGLLVLHDKTIPRLCNDGHNCDYALRFSDTDYSGLLVEMSDTLIWVKFTAEDDSVNLFRFNTADTNALNLKKVQLYAACGDTVLSFITIGNTAKTKYLELTGLVPGNTYYLKFLRKTNSYAAQFWLDSPDLRLFANVASECNDTASDTLMCLWFSDYSDVYPQETFNKFVWKVYTADSNDLVFTDTTFTDTTRINTSTLGYGEYYYKMEERDAKNILLRTWEMPDYMEATFRLRFPGEPVDYAELYEDEVFENEEIDLFRPVGTIVGMHGTTPTGGATYTIPIPVPPGTNGMIPNIALSYNSQAGNGIMGMGWGLSGLPVITRIGKDWHHYPGSVSGVNLNEYDQFALDGNRLIKRTNGVYGADGTVYTTEMEAFSIITSYGKFAGKNNNPAYFKIETKEGIQMLFGNTSNSKFLSESNDYIIAYRLSLVFDKYGNYITFNYDNTQRESRVVSIKYTGNFNQLLQPYNEIKFEYEPGRIDENTVFVGDSRVRTRFLLKKIIIVRLKYCNKSVQFNTAKDFRMI